MAFCSYIAFHIMQSKMQECCMVNGCVVQLSSDNTFFVQSPDSVNMMAGCRSTLGQQKLYIRSVSPPSSDYLRP